MTARSKGNALGRTFGCAFILLLMASMACFVGLVVYFFVDML
jgi:hypothetical protein